MNLVETLINDNKVMFDASRANVRKFFNENTIGDLVDHFNGRMVNERMNMVAISDVISKSSFDTDPDELVLLAKQALDEAKHFKMVKEVIEYITEEEVNVESYINKEKKDDTAKGASIIDKLKLTSYEYGIPLYQLIAEGRAAEVWDEMAMCIEDDFISSTYKKIAKDEEFHSNIGKNKLMKIFVSTDYDPKEVMDMADSIRKELYFISCTNTTIDKEFEKKVYEAYGWDK